MSLTSEFSSQKPRIIANLHNSYLNIPSRVLKPIVSKKGIIFDLDGTLIDMERANFLMYSGVIKKTHGLEISQFEWSWIFAGRRPQESIPDFLKLKGEKPEIFNFERFKELAGPIKNDLISNHLNKVAFLLPGAGQFLRRLWEQNLILALATSTIGRFVTAILEHFDIDKYFQVVLTGENVSRGKPNPEIYLKTLGALKLKPDTCLVFEDSSSGVEAALRAGVDVIRIKNQ